ncbi:MULTISPECIES: PDR/VanB family oxidoreductase [unclassified Rhodococcus (in: high G+C Gram-positive bacteria)]|uniref:PDR/VanB family oxidoreductase n=1 Tax=unclassified Rhodococcus (in: high G+C Gram-positive bacteria) TaxID=192944 RepID=UPI00163A478A|nr:MULTISPECIES: PDR/VanB family oxidoreductase [unclassified Rhodococcus (in: high G+C Gram-positive bacteria)]MBC2640469.1 oxidoreductase [Rhodococcus sp. 3A]MBC2894785.1 oxidoreductase [Rhodococcus sp. 4CII]
MSQNPVSSGAPADAALRVVAKEAVAEGVVALTLRHPTGRRLPDWAPGAHIDLVFPTGLTRQYSLCGDRWDAHTYRIGVLREPVGRGGSAYVHDELAEGDVVGVGGPRNNFPLVPSQRYLFIAGGIGITPLLPMIRQAELVGADWTLVYGGRTRTSMAFRDELAAYGDRVVVAPRDECGLPDLPTHLAAADATDTRVYVCGPGPLLGAVENYCAHWPVGQLRTERFVPKDRGASLRDEPFEVELARSGLAVTVSPGATVLDAVQAAGVNVLSSCREGTCGTCETTVLAGAPDHRDSVLDDDERSAGDCMLICVSRSCSDRLVLDL